MSCRRGVVCFWGESGSFQGTTGTGWGPGVEGSGPGAGWGEMEGENGSGETGLWKSKVNNVWKPEGEQPPQEPQRMRADGGASTTSSFCRELPESFP